MNKVQTINLKGNEYALVPQRLKAFREANPRASITTHPEFQADGIVLFTAKIVQDKADQSSPEATGHSFGKSGGDKAFEKLETVAVGRALALLGYLNNGQVATTEEMEEFEEYKQEQLEQSIRGATKREEFTAILASLTPAQKLLATPLINQRIKELKDGDSGTSGTTNA